MNLINNLSRLSMFGISLFVRAKTKGKKAQKQECWEFSHFLCGGSRDASIHRFHSNRVDHQETIEEQQHHPMKT